MASVKNRCFFLLASVLFFLAIAPRARLVNAQQNIEVFYPSSPPTPAPTPPTIPPPPTPALLQPPPQPPPPSPTKSDKQTIATAVAATAASTLVISGLLFFLLKRRAVSRRRNEESRSDGGLPTISRDDFTRFHGNVKGLIVDEDGLDVLYWRKLQGRSGKSHFEKEPLRSPEGGGGEAEEEGGAPRRDRRRNSEPIQEIHLLREKSTTSYDYGPFKPEANDPVQNVMPAFPSPPPAGLVQEAVEISSAAIRPPNAPALPAPPLLPVPPPPPIPPAKRSTEVLTSSAIGTKTRAAPPPPPPIPAPKAPPPPRAGGLASSLKPPPPLPKAMPGANKPGDSSSGSAQAGTDQVKLKPLHWDKVNIANAEHSMVWNKIEGGSFKFDDDMMTALFGSVAANRKSPRGDASPAIPGAGAGTGPSGQIFILDPRRSQNIAIVLKSLTVSRKEILGALAEGQGLDADTLEKLDRIAPTEEEEAQILGFGGGDPTRLADAESFLYHLLKAVPSAFTRFGAMLFRLNYESEILQLRESVQTIESGCKELRSRGLFMKLLEAILKAGNHMNAGTSRGNAQAFNLTSLRKLSDVKSTDGKTTLLHFVVEEVVRAEGKRCVANRNRSSFSRISSHSSGASANSENRPSREEREKEYMTLGLPIVGGLNAEFSNVKKAAAIDYETFAASCVALTSRAEEIRQLVSRDTGDGGGGFARVMRGFLEAAGDELSDLRKDQAAATEMAKRTTEYYQAGASKDRGANPLQLFVIVKDFLNMVDQACVEIARNQQRRRMAAASSGSSPPTSPAARPPVRFPKLPPHFLSDKSRSTSSGSDTDF